MECKEIHDEQQWNEWLCTCNPNTFLQSWEWGQIQKDDGGNVRYIGVFDNIEQVAAALLVTVYARRGCFILCPHGPIIKGSLRKAEILQVLVDYCRDVATKDKAVAVRIAPLFVSDTENWKLFHLYGFRAAPIHIHAELTWVLDISGNENDILGGMRKTTRHAISKAEKEGVQVEISTNPNDIDRFFPLYEETQSRHKFVPFSRKFLMSQVDRFHKNDRMYMVFSSHKGEDVAAAIIVQFGNTVFYHHGASRLITSKVPAAQLLHWGSIREAKRRGATTYNFWGIAPEGQPNHPFAGITIFKKGFGGKPIQYMHLQDLPLSYRYWKLWTVEMFRKKRRGF